MTKIHYIWIAGMLGLMPKCGAHTKFSRIESCYDPTQTPETYHIITDISVPLCGVVCARDERCKSISIKRDGNTVTCYHNSGRRLLSTGCDNQYRHFNGYHSSCHYHGVFLNGTYGCRCYDGYIGAWCERLMEDCTEGASTDHYRDFRESDVFHIHPSNSPRDFKVVCIMDRWVPGWTVFISRQLGQFHVNFSRTWEDYKNGFGNFSLKENFWSGLDLMYYVTNNRPHKLRISVQFQENGTRVWKKHDYPDFKVSCEEHGYNFTFSSAVPPRIDEAIDEISPLLGVRFTTYDVDNDKDSNDSCARIHQSGWWFTTCGGYNPTGQPQPLSVQYKTSDPTQLSWPHPLNYSALKMKMYVMAETN